MKDTKIENAEIGSYVYFCGMKWEVMPMQSFKYCVVRCGLHLTQLPNDALVSTKVDYHE